ncbi:MAG: oligosaccharide flippase family protein [Parafilimonas sp.]|nr:oligosaccharide flippase family protein [Parafilimonas sp.]
MAAFISKFKKLSKKEENKELIKHSFAALIARIGGAIAAFLMNLVVARYLGASEAGYFFLAVTITTLISTIGRIGADQTILRFVGIYSSASDWNKVHGVLRKIINWSNLTTIPLTAIICVFSKQISVYIFHKEELQWPLFWTSLSIPFFTLYNIYGMALQGRKKVLLSVTGLKVLTPVFLIILILIFAFNDGKWASIGYTIACFINLIFAYYWWRKKLPPESAREAIDSSALWKSCGPLWIVAIMNVITTWGGQFIAGIFNNSKELAQLAVTRNTTILVSFVLTAVNNVSAPRFAVMYSEGKMNQLKNYARNTTLLMTLVALPITLFLWFFPEFILSFFGKDFKDGAWLLRIFSIGQFVSVISGSVGYLLNMTGHEKDMRNVMVINAALSIVLALILNPIYGIIGSALASAISIASTNLMAVGYVKKRLGFSTISIFGFK